MTGGTGRKPPAAGRGGIDIEELKDEMTRLEEEAKTAMLVAVDGQPAGIIAVADA